MKKKISITFKDPSTQKPQSIKDLFKEHPDGVLTIGSSGGKFNLQDAMEEKEDDRPTM
jgi:hypothetical protein